MGYGPGYGVYDSGGGCGAPKTWDEDDGGEDVGHVEAGGGTRHRHGGEARDQAANTYHGQAGAGVGSGIGQGRRLGYAGGNVGTRRGQRKRSAPCDSGGGYDASGNWCHDNADEGDLSEQPRHGCWGVGTVQTGDGGGWGGDGSVYGDMRARQVRKLGYTGGAGVGAGVGAGTGVGAGGAGAGGAGAGGAGAVVDAGSVFGGYGLGGTGERGDQAAEMRSADLGKLPRRRSDVDGSDDSDFQHGPGERWRSGNPCRHTARTQTALCTTFQHPTDAEPIAGDYRTPQGSKRAPAPDTDKRVSSPRLPERKSKAIEKAIETQERRRQEAMRRRAEEAALVQRVADERKAQDKAAKLQLAREAAERFLDPCNEDQLVELGLLVASVAMPRIVWRDVSHWHWTIASP
jgi:hypothetical protein